MYESFKTFDQSLLKYKIYHIYFFLTISFECCDILHLSKIKREREHHRF